MRTRAGAAITVAITLCILYFAVGLIAVWLGWMTMQTYLNAAGVVGGIASVLGLLSLSRPTLAQSDIDGIEAQSLQKLAKTSTELKELESKRLSTKQDIETLEESHKRLEAIVQKAALVLFLKEQLRRSTTRIAEALKASPELLQQIDVYGDTSAKLHALDEEIASDRNVDLIRQVIDMSGFGDGRKPQRPADAVMDIFENVFSAYVKLFSRFVR